MDLESFVNGLMAGNFNILNEVRFPLIDVNIYLKEINEKLKEKGSKMRVYFDSSDKISGGGTEMCFLSIRNN